MEERKRVENLVTIWIAQNDKGKDIIVILVSV